MHELQAANDNAFAEILMDLADVIAEEWGLPHDEARWVAVAVGRAAESPWVN